MSARTWDKQIETFLRHEAGFLDSSPEFSSQPLREILEAVRYSNPYTAISNPTHSNCRILVDSLSASGQRQREVLNDAQFFSFTEPDDARRTTFYITDLSPLCLATLGVKENADFVHTLRQYFHCHLTGETSLLALTPRNHNASAGNTWPRHVATARKFTYEFHLPYVALRNRDVLPDPRHWRKWYSFINAFDPERDAFEQKGYDLACYDAHISFLIIGRHENDWKAYCNTDTWFDNQPIEDYISDDLDAPAGDARSASDPCMDPREYFLLVLAHRLRQITHEWGNLSSVLIDRLSAYESHYLDTIDVSADELYDDHNLTRTRTYLKAASMLRHFHDTVSTTLNSYDAFMKDRKEDDDLFVKQEDFQDRCGCYENMIRYHIIHLSSIRNRFKEKMERFESMRESIMTASLLRENQRASNQSRDIELLTKVTVFFLPFTLAATLMGMSEKWPSASMWIIWGVLSMCLAIPMCLSCWNLLRLQMQPSRTPQWETRRNQARPRYPAPTLAQYELPEH